MHNSWVFHYFFQKSLFAENNFRIAAINLTTRGQLYTCLVIFATLFLLHLKKSFAPLKLSYIRVSSKFAYNILFHSYSWTNSILSLYVMFIVLKQ